MKIYKIAFPLPLGEIPIEHGETNIDNYLTEQEASYIEEKFNLVRRLGSGMWGIAYLTIDDNVFKLTLDMDEFEAAQEIMSVKYGPFAKIYETGEIKDNVWYIIKEKVIPLTDEEQYLFMNCVDLYHENSEIESPYIDKSFAQKVEDFIIDVENYAFADTMNPNNIGWDTYGNLVAFDVRLGKLGGFI